MSLSVARPAPEAVRGRSLVAWLLGSAFAMLLAVAAYFIYTSGPEEKPVDAPKNLPDMQSSVKSTQRPTKPTTPSSDAPSMFATRIANSGLQRSAEAEAEVRKKIEEYFRLIFLDAEHQENAAHYKEKRAELEAYLAGLPPEMVPLLLEMLETEKDFINQYILIKALGEIGSDLAAQALADRFEWAAATGDIKEIEKTIQALGRVQTDYSFDLLSGAVVNDTHAYLTDRHRFVEQLGVHPRAREAVPLFLEQAEESPDMLVRNKSAQALKRVKDPATAVDIERLLKKEQSEFVRQTMLGALSAIGDRASMDTIAEIAQTDDNDSTRASAVESIYLIGGPRAKELLAKIAEQDPDEKVRERAKNRARKLEEDGH